MTTLTLKLSKALDAQLTTAAKLRRASKTALARKALEDYLLKSDGGRIIKWVKTLSTLILN